MVYNDTTFFRNIFLGETFSSYISVHNDSAHMCTDVQVKVNSHC